ncbi:hypothetical protein HDU84_000810, partial [Entophlyctis sp. JEL0112]
EEAAWESKLAADVKTLEPHFTAGSSDHSREIDKLKHGIPLPYVLGFHEFCGHKFIGNEDVMIPKRGTETLVESAASHARRPENATGSPPTDLGPGHRSLLQAILARIPGSTGVGIDLSEPALAVARRNAAALLQNHPSRAVFGRAAFFH